MTNKYLYLNTHGQTKIYLAITNPALILVRCHTNGTVFITNHCVSDPSINSSATQS